MLEAGGQWRNHERSGTVLTLLGGICQPPLASWTHLGEPELLQSFLAIYSGCLLAPQVRWGQLQAPYPDICLELLKEGGLWCPLGWWWGLR